MLIKFQGVFEPSKHEKALGRIQFLIALCAEEQSASLIGSLNLKLQRILTLQSAVIKGNIASGSPQQLPIMSTSGCNGAIRVPKKPRN